MEQGTIVIGYQLTWGEWRRIYWGASMKKSISAFALFFGFFFGISTLLFANHNQVAAIVIAILALVSVVSRFWIAPRRYWNSAIGVQEAKRVEIGDEGIVRTSESLEERLAWDRFRSASDTKDYFILKGPSGSASVYLPKRGLRTPEDEAVLLRLILTHIPSS
ncbi:MAG TPA: YcxB family protein [Acidimicrobiales bacterium]